MNEAVDCRVDIMATRHRTSRGQLLYSTLSAWPIYGNR